MDTADEMTEDEMDGLGCAAVVIAVLFVVGFFLWDSSAADETTKEN